MKELVPRIEDCKKISTILSTEAKNLIERDGLITLNHISLATIHNDTNDKRIF